MMIQLVYVSTAKNKILPQALKEILEKSIKNNAESGITGMLLYHNGTFLQVLEGFESHVNDLYALISSDSRHKEMHIIYTVPIQERVFENWSMGVVDVEELIKKGDKDFIHFFDLLEKNDQTELEQRQAQTRQIIDKFKLGAWRNYID